MFEAAKFIVAVYSLFLIVRTVKHCENKYIAFVVVALWLRFFLAAYHSFTYVPLLGGLSITALFSILIAGVGIFFIPKQMFLLKRLLPFYAFFAAIIISGIYNLEIKDLINVSIKWLYFLCICVAFFVSVRLSSLNSSCKHAMQAFVLPISLQVLSVLLGERKVTDNLGVEFSYIGGYFHESGFSMIIVGFIILLSMLPAKTYRFQSLMFLAGVVCIYLTNYRTAILAVLPVVVIYFYGLMEQKVAKRYRLPVIFLFLILGLAAITTLFSLQQERFGDIFVFADSWQKLLKAPFYYTELEKDIFSARVYIWSEYLYAFSTSDFWQQFLGHGPESWNGIFEKYAHNTYISYLYEYGYIGFISFIYLNIYLLFSAWRVKDRVLSQKLFYSYLGFLIMNLATMPLWALEGMIVYAILISVTFANPNPIYKLRDIK
ncbi:MAG: O-antigen ligase family protein [Paraglaciecola sp.]|nr:O-antigen ligase family protein [Paraglaciecola sp.]